MVSYLVCLKTGDETLFETVADNMPPEWIHQPQAKAEPPQDMEAQAKAFANQWQQ